MPLNVKNWDYVQLQLFKKRNNFNNFIMKVFHKKQIKQHKASFGKKVNS